jgi:hypothetical protein
MGRGYNAGPKINRLKPKNHNLAFTFFAQPRKSGLAFPARSGRLVS